MKRNSHTYEHPLPKAATLSAIAFANSASEQSGCALPGGQFPNIERRL